VVLELFLHPAGASGQASIAATRGASDIRKWPIASAEIPEEGFRALRKFQETSFSDEP
jgi:hypothetical protein